MNEDPGAMMNYYNKQPQPDSMMYRLDADSIIERAVDTFSGGVKTKINGRKIYYEERRLMNDLGISRARMMLEAGVNKINHLTKYKDEERVFRQVKAMVRAWVYSVGCNMKKWAPEAKFDVKGKLINPDHYKIRDKYLIISTIENSILQSMLRGTGGFEAEISGKQMVVTETKDFSTVQKDDPNQMGGWFGRGQGGY